MDRGSKLAKVFGDIKEKGRSHLILLLICTHQENAMDSCYLYPGMRHFV